MDCPCGRPITRNQWGAECDDDYQDRLDSGRCRKKCRREYPAKREVSKPTLHLISACYDRGEGRIQKKEIPEVDEPYLAWIRTLPCTIPGCAVADRQAHHQSEKGKGGKSTKVSSYRCIPLCCWHHTLGGTERLPGSYHGMAKLTGWRFWQHYAVDVETVIHRLNAEWLEKNINESYDRRG